MVTLTKSLLPASTFACGPAQALAALRPVALADTFFERNHRAADVVKNLYQKTAEELKELFELSNDYTVCVFPGGANNAMDAVLWNLTLDTLSGLAFGEFSTRWASTLAARLPHLKNTVRFAPKGQFFPSQEPDYNASLIVLTPNETSTGVQIPNDYLSHVWNSRGKDTLVAWDCTSCAGGRVLPKNQFDVMLFSLQKCFGVMGGTCVMFIHKRVQTRLAQTSALRAIPYALDLTRALEQARRFQTVNTPNTTAIWMCYQAARWMNTHGKLSAMDALCRAHAQWLVRWALGTDYIKPLVADENLRSYTTLTLQLTDPHLQAEDINRALAQSGLANLQDGLKRHPYAPENTLRVACFPFVDTDGVNEYKKLTATLDEIVRQLRKH